MVSGAVLLISTRPNVLSQTYSPYFFGTSQPACRIPFRQMIDTGLQFRIGLEREQPPGRFRRQAFAHPRQETIEYRTGLC